MRKSTLHPLDRCGGLIPSSGRPYPSAIEEAGNGLERAETLCLSVPDMRLLICSRAMLAIRGRVSDRPEVLAGAKLEAAKNSANWIVGAGPAVVSFRTVDGLDEMRMVFTWPYVGPDAQEDEEPFSFRDSA